MGEDRPPDAATTGSLLERALGGDREAQNQLFAEYTQKLASSAWKHALMSFLQDRYGAEDIAQEVWERCFDRKLLGRFEYRGRGSFDAYLEKILDRTMRDLGRNLGAEKRTPNREAFSFDEGSADTRASSLHALPPSREQTPTSHSRLQEYERLAQNALGPRRWEIWRLSQREGYKSEEIGARLGLSPERVRGLLMESRRELLRVFASLEE